MHSIRQWLPASYALIAGMATGVLGIVLMLILRDYYVRREYDYLSGNAGAIASSLWQSAAFTGRDLQTTVQSLSFLSQARVRVLDPQGGVLADSGPMSEQDVLMFVSSESGAPGTSGVIVASSEAQAVPVPGAVLMPAGGSLYGFEFNSAVPQPSGPRSDVVVQAPWYDPYHTQLGTVELSEGPAYGRDILLSVVWGWALAGVVAIALSALAGWFVSRQLSTPLLALTSTTMRMADGDLSARADARRTDELGTLARAFNEMAGRVELTVSALRRFVADAAHELHTPLTALRTDLELTAEATDTEAQRARVTRALAQADVLHRLAADLLDLSRLDAGVPEGTPDTLDFAALVQQSAERYASQAEQAGLAFTLVLPHDAVWVAGYAQHLQRAVDNLLDNAVKFTPTGAISVTLDAPAAAALTLTIRDTGIGIPPDDRAQIGGRFHRGRNALGIAGNGLGLAIVKAIAAEHAGALSVASTEAGTTVTLRLPRVAAKN